jgi:uncharacterized protein YhhL (DUF1145 family)
MVITAIILIVMVLVHGLETIVVLKSKIKNITELACMVTLGLLSIVFCSN